MYLVLKIWGESNYDPYFFLKKKKSVTSSNIKDAVLVC